jgi:hypothetical protein
MLSPRTHRMVKDPQISARYLADFMAASERARRTIVQKCKYQAISRVVQHDEAKVTVSRFIRERNTNIRDLREEATRLRSRLADNDFDRDLYDHNADYIDRFADIFSALVLPDAERLAPGRTPPLELRGTKITVEIHLRFRRLTKTNKVRVGAAMLRYSKGKPLSDDTAKWQSSFLFGYLGMTNTEEAAEPEHKLCVTIDAYTGVAHAAPTDAVRRFQNMRAACETIAEWWPRVAPPTGAVL